MSKICNPLFKIIDNDNVLFGKIKLKINKQFEDIIFIEKEEHEFWKCWKKIIIKNKIFENLEDNLLLLKALLKISVKIDENYYLKNNNCIHIFTLSKIDKNKKIFSTKENMYYYIDSNGNIVFMSINKYLNFNEFIEIDYQSEYNSKYEIVLTTLMDVISNYKFGCCLLSGSSIKVSKKTITFIY